MRCGRHTALRFPSPTNQPTTHAVAACQNSQLPQSPRFRKKQRRKGRLRPRRLSRGVDGRRYPPCRFGRLHPQLGAVVLHLVDHFSTASSLPIINNKTSLLGARQVWLSQRLLFCLAIAIDYCFFFFSIRQDVHELTDHQAHDHLTFRKAGNPYLLPRSLFPERVATNYRSEPSFPG